MHQYIFGLLTDNLVHTHSASFAVPVKSDPFGGDPFKGSDPFAADSFFAQTSSAPYSSDDPFSASADPFGTTAGMPEPDLFAAKLNESAAAPAVGPDPFTSKPTNPGLVAKDPFMTTGNSMADSDPFGGKMNASGESDPFGSQDRGTDPFSCSPPSSDLAVVSKLSAKPGHNIFTPKFGGKLTKKTNINRPIILFVTS